MGDKAEDTDGCSVITCKVTDHPTGIYIKRRTDDITH
jgi:hypothetical protein